MIEIFAKLRDLLDARERRNALLLFAMMVVMGLMEVLGVVSVVPFLAVVADPEVVQENAKLAAVYDYLGFTSTQGFLVFLGACVFVVVVGRLGFTALTQWAVARYSSMRTYSLSSRLLRGYLGRPYSFFLNRHSADLGKAVLSEVSSVTSKTLMPAVNLVANAIVATLLIALVVVVNPMVAISAVALLGGAYALIYLGLKPYITRIGAERVRANRARFQLAQEALGGIKDVKVLGLEDGYIRGFRRPAKRFARVQANAKIIGELPQFGLRALVFGGMLVLLIGLLVAYDGDLGAVLPLIGLYAFAGTRLIPALQKVYRALISLRFGKPALDLLHEDMVDIERTGAPAAGGTNDRAAEPIILDRELKLEQVRYTYPGAERPALDDLSLTIPAYTTVGLVGSTGAGKTTAVDLILGLLEPQRGRLLVDDRPITKESVRAWQRNIGYVPQAIFLTDDTVAANIAFGVPNDEINHDAIERAARIAELHEFVVREMPDGYQTPVGERGVRLSGGQRQRIGIARALYHDPGVLVLDEATSALDNVTEMAVMDAVHNLSHRKTIIIIAHRVSTVRECDQIFLLDHGRLKSQGSYSELLGRSSQFRRMAGEALERVE